MDKKLVVLVCDDDALMLQTLNLRLRSLYEVHTSNSVEQAEVMLDSIKFDIAILDINFEGQEKTGAYLQDVFSRRSPSTSIIIHSGDNDITRIVDVKDRKHAALIVKGQDTFNDLLNIMNRMTKSKRGEKGVSQGNMVTFSPKMQEVLSRIDMIIEKNNCEPILILGESGVGKEYLVKYIAKKSSNKEPVCENMSCIQESLAESKLFGHVKGAFTGAIDSATGLFEQANGGIIFMDEIAEASPATQAKLLRVIEEKEVMRVGESRPRKIDVRIISGTHRDLLEMITEGTFRKDLYFRLASFTITIPPLRERAEDMMYIANGFLEKLNSGSTHKEQYKFSSDVEEALLTYHWPGNIRELGNFISTLNVELPSKYVITKNDILKLLQKKPQYISGTETMTVSETKTNIYRKAKEKLELALREYNGNISLAAASLKIHRTTFHRRMKILGIQSV